MKQNVIFSWPGKPVNVATMIGILGAGLYLSHSLIFLPDYSFLKNSITSVSDMVSSEFSTPTLPVSTQAVHAVQANPVAAVSIPDVPKLPSSYNDLIAEAASRNGLDQALIMAVMAAESNFNPRAISSSGAHGLMQLMPATARTYGVRNTFDPRQSISAGARYLSYLMNRFDGNLKLALAAYNAGPTSVVRSGYKVPPIAETRDYVKKVLAYYTYYQSI